LPLSANYLYVAFIVVVFVAISFGDYVIFVIYGALMVSSFFGLYSSRQQSTFKQLLRNLVISHQASFGNAGLVLAVNPEQSMCERRRFFVTVKNTPIVVEAQACEIPVKLSPIVSDGVV
jgi:uncharacterized membrane protein (DUF4010 family)